MNTLYNALLNHPDFGKIDWSMLKCADRRRHGGAEAVADAWMQGTGKPIIEGYGLSETSPVLTCNRGDITEWTGTIGLPLPSTEISIRDDDGQRRAAWRARRDLRARPAGDGRLLAAAGRNRQGDDRGRIFSHRRHRHDGRRRAACASSIARRT